MEIPIEVENTTIRTRSKAMSLNRAFDRIIATPPVLNYRRTGRRTTPPYVKAAITASAAAIRATTAATSDARIPDERYATRLIVAENRKRAAAIQDQVSEFMYSPILRLDGMQT